MEEFDELYQTAQDAINMDDVDADNVIQCIKERLPNRLKSNAEVANSCSDLIVLLIDLEEELLA